MAKQSGIHQLRGKVGEHSYYRQTGVTTGLMRSINQGMSQRVKTGDEYVNTRLNNTEFGAAGNVAGLLGQMVYPKFRPMVLPFSQSKMAKEVLKLARQNTADWGKRVVTSADTARLCDILSATSKRNPLEFVSIELSRDAVDFAEVKVSYTADQATLMDSLGITNISVKYCQYDLATGQWNPLAQIMATGYIQPNEVGYPFNVEDVVSGTANETEESFEVAEFIPEANHAGHQIVVCVIMPTRAINGKYHVLQEYCSFVAMPLPAAE